MSKSPFRPTLRPSLALALGLALLGGACRQATAPSEPDPTSARSEATAEEAAAPPEFVAIVTSKVNKVIVAEVEAKVEALPVSVGERVKAGVPIARLDEGELKSRLESAKFAEKAAAGEVGAASISARAAADRARIEQRLARMGASGRGAVATARAEAGSLGAQAGGAAGRLAQARNERHNVEAMLAKTTVRSPIDGVVTRIKLREGSLAQKGTPIAHVFDDSDLRIKFMVPAEHRRLLTVGQKITFQVEGSDVVVAAAITSISPELEPPANVTIAEADLDDSRLAPDQIRVASSGKVRLAGVVR